MVLSSQNLYKRHMLQKGLKGLKFAVQQQNLISGDLQARVKGRLLARYWLKVGLNSFDIIITFLCTLKEFKKSMATTYIFRRTM